MPPDTTGPGKDFFFLCCFGEGTGEEKALEDLDEKEVPRDFLRFPLFLAADQTLGTSSLPAPLDLRLSVLLLLLLASDN